MVQEGASAVRRVQSLACCTDAALNDRSLTNGRLHIARWLPPSTGHSNGRTFNLLCGLAVCSTPRPTTGHFANCRHRRVVVDVATFGFL